MTARSPIVLRTGADVPSVVLRRQEEWGIQTLDLVNPPRRLWSDQRIATIAVEPGVDAKRVRELPTPADILESLPEGDNWTAQSRRSIARLWSYFLICEDPQRRLDARAVQTLAHQVSLVRHVLDNDRLSRVFIADEVGLGKTVEVGLIIKELLEQRPSLRILYLAPARLVSNVRREFDKLELNFRQWTASDADARLNDPRIIASIHRAVFGANAEHIVKSGPWDVIVVDECHHLSDWAAGGGDPRQKFKLVRDLIAKQSQSCRVLFLSGTPHQGHRSRFENLLGLLKQERESFDDLTGRVIYRIKDDVQDWDGNPLFPQRKVNEPRVVDLGNKYMEWIQHIHDFYQPPPGENSGAEPRRRAAGWRCAQAMQWAASSPQAGVGYLARQAIRAEWTLEESVLLEALKALRPYRSGPEDESIDLLFARIKREVKRQRDAGDIEDIEEMDEEVQAQETEGLRDLLSEGLSILKTAPDDKWRFIKEQLLDPASDEKAVLFAQPIETVTALARFLKKTMGVEPAVIIGGQSDAERNAEIVRFVSGDGCRFLVSSRAGGEGINLQVARRLIHVDVPWNPMDMEQRVGRVHRFGSRKPIIVDTVVVKNSREADAYRIAREKLQLIASALVAPQRFETAFARVMCLIPPEELQDIIIQGPLAPFTGQEHEQINKIVQDGFNRWNDFHQKFSSQQKEIRQQDRGLASWDDLRNFLVEYGNATVVDGFNAQKFRWNSGEIDAVDEAAQVVSIGDTKYCCGDFGGAPVYGPNGLSVAQVGLNISAVAELLRRHVFPDVPCGAAHLRWNKNCPLPGATTRTPFGVLVYLKQVVQADATVGFAEQSIALQCFILTSNGEVLSVDGADKTKLLRGIFQSTVRTRPEPAGRLQEILLEQQNELMVRLQRPSEEEIEQRIRFGITPLFASIVTDPT